MNDINTLLGNLWLFLTYASAAFEPIGTTPPPRYGYLFNPLAASLIVLKVENGCHAMPLLRMFSFTFSTPSSIFWDPTSRWVTVCSIAKL